MDIVKLHIPYRFVRARMSVNWSDVHFGLANELLDPQAPLELAAQQIAELPPSPPSALKELLRDGASDVNLGLVQQLADAAPSDEAETRQRWLYIVLAWFYDHRDTDPDPLQRVEEVYGDFGYPNQIAGFVRFMPMQGSDLGNSEANVRRLFDRWRMYLEQASLAYSR